MQKLTSILATTATATSQNEGHLATDASPLFSWRTLR